MTRLTTPLRSLSAMLSVTTETLAPLADTESDKWDLFSRLDVGDPSSRCVLSCCAFCLLNSSTHDEADSAKAVVSNVDGEASGRISGADRGDCAGSSLGFGRTWDDDRVGWFEEPSSSVFPAELVASEMNESDMVLFCMSFLRCGGGGYNNEEEEVGAREEVVAARDCCRASVIRSTSISSSIAFPSVGRSARIWYVQSS